MPARAYATAAVTRLVQKAGTRLRAESVATNAYLVASGTRVDVQ